uniref:Helicase-associated domain-containing protein n=1 Tax=Trieres chinensis TaxID=1514140 RepID=A0A7S1ZFL4_TRICV|mmetsp:Transcript_24162/g.48949  ORF Transcript_24162/g.48949 Transcript_24162/m.48949 type:complete len:441 (+) Transcript_24162:390-1712(+)|eukprot:CAMPEP_0183301250 /NCGR_PEP_ID=MMETSP0160_2-20130417/7416_1 /TAXON_ID=2839 ORGANISM="Odontella Sinensis, Strain Grunow 1884" /NCGR_SAMPLE_ID=MMETSP0160_2 /ASSEMBLY_ACC=CAM_ASM_000250 /LENGTH=440 /DNA_ID=CAMNT_0025463821 /DNA_START=310 /DNA_END=1632 /DNA_ORIENTATION=+
MADHPSPPKAEPNVPLPPVLESRSSTVPALPTVAACAGPVERPCGPAERRNSLPTTLSNAQDLIDTAVASRKLSFKDNPTLQMKWDQMYHRLLSFRERHGHCLVPNRYKEDRSLGQWVSAQRRQYKQMQAGEDTPMTEERAKMLEGMGFVWATLERGHVPWEIRYGELLEYQRNYGDCLVPIGFKENPQLSSWVSTQRQEMKLLRDGRPTRLTEERIRLLNKAGFVWESQRGKRGGRKKRKSSGLCVGVSKDLLAPPLSRSSSLAEHAGDASFGARPSGLVSRIVTDTSSDSSHGSAYSAYHHQSYFEGTHPSAYNYPKGETCSKKGRIGEQEAPSTTYPQQGKTEPNPADDIFADADEEDEDSQMASAFQAQRKRQSEGNPVLMMATTNGQTCSSSSGTHEAPQNNPSSLSKAAQKAPGYDKSKEDAAVALLSVGRAMA